MSITENIRYGFADATDEAVEAAASLAHVHAFTQDFTDGMATLVGERGVRLSGGQKQRVAVARAAVRDPRILLLDEATSALDAESEHVVRNALAELMRGRSSLVIAHRLSTVRDADSVLVMAEGTIVERGSHADLLAADGVYNRLVCRQLEAEEDMDKA
mmetsp:Transcript_56763/g.123375  ORF Transcript_56763/g.123375 Transcript_56763/m.123375 type:complete len:159 (+) Transcript_56763:1473-1949(+)